MDAPEPKRISWVLLLRGLLVCALYASGALKAIDGLTGGSHRAMRQPVLIALAAIAEIVLAAALSTRYWRWAAILVAALHLGFAALAYASALSGAPSTSCGCFGPLHVGPAAEMAVATVLFGTAAAIASSPLRGPFSEAVNPPP